MEINNLYKTIERLKEKYPEDIKRIELESVRVKALMERVQYSKNPITQELLAKCRKDVSVARRKLATDKTLIGNEGMQRDLWTLIESRLLFMEFVSGDFESEIESMAVQLEGDLES